MDNANAFFVSLGFVANIAFLYYRRYQLHDVLCVTIK
jgi:hypothetical protein